MPNILFRYTFLLFLFSNIFAQPSPSIILNTDYYNASRYNNNSNSARLNDGTIMAVWEPSRQPNKEVWLTSYDILFEAWASPLQISNSQTQFSNPGDADTGAPGLVADDNGNVFACWKQKNDKSPGAARFDMVFSKWNGSTWSEPVIVEPDTGNAGFGSINLAPDGKITIAYSDYGTSFGVPDIHVAWSSDAGETWNHQNLTQGQFSYYWYVDPATTHGPDGSLVCAWFDEPDTTNKLPGEKYPLKEVMLSAFDGEKWSQPIIATPKLAEGDSNNSCYPALCTDSNNQVHVIYTQNENQLVHSIWDGAQLSTPVRIDNSADSMRIYRSSAASDDAGNLYVVWRQQTIKQNGVDVDNVFYSISQDQGRSWSTPVQLSDATTEDGGDYSVLWPSIGKKVRGPIESVFEGGADVIWTQFNPESENGWDLMYGRIPLAGAQSDVEQKGPFNDLNFKLNQNYPNPFNPETRISFELAVSTEVNLSIYNLLGEKVNTLIAQKLNAGFHSFSWDGRSSKNKSLPGGIYFYKLTSNGFSQTKRMLLLK